MAPLGFLTTIVTLTLASQARAWYNELPACLDEFQPFVPVGCFDNGLVGENAALSMKTDLSVTGMTTEICVAECKGELEICCLFCLRASVFPPSMLENGWHSTTCLFFYLANTPNQLVD
jgi:hypothetical protein